MCCWQGFRPAKQVLEEAELSTLPGNSAGRGKIHSTQRFFCFAGAVRRGMLRAAPFNCEFPIARLVQFIPSEG